jgi:hypothetical protein
MAKFYDAQNDSQAAVTGDLTTFDAADISAYRWNAMAKFYDAQNDSQAAVTGDLTTFDAADISAYRWNAMARFYEKQAFLTQFDPTE